MHTSEYCAQMIEKQSILLAYQIEERIIQHLCTGSIECGQTLIPRVIYRLSKLKHTEVVRTN